MPQSIQITETSPLLHDANCVYCHVDLALSDRAVVCDRCQSPHHADCWQANDHECAMFGCAIVEHVVTQERHDVPATQSTDVAAPQSELSETNPAELYSEPFGVTSIAHYIRILLAVPMVVGIFAVVMSAISASLGMSLRIAIGLFVGWLFWQVVHRQQARDDS